MERKRLYRKPLLVVGVMLVGFLTLCMIGCEKKSGGGEPSSPSAGGTTSGGDAVVSQYTKVEDYPAQAITKIRELGKTVRNEKLVVVGGNSNSTQYNVHIFQNGQVTNYEYKFYTTGSKSLFDAFKVDTVVFAETNDPGQWTLQISGPESGDWQSAYDTAKRLAESLKMTVIVE